jgi:hypothetical protein
MPSTRRDTEVNIISKIRELCLEAISDLVIVMTLTRARAGAAVSGAFAVSERVLEGSGVGPCQHWRRPVLFLDRACRMRRHRVKAPKMFPALPL